MLFWYDLKICALIDQRMPYRFDISTEPQSHRAQKQFCKSDHCESVNSGPSLPKTSFRFCQFWYQQVEHLLSYSFLVSIYFCVLT